MARTAQEIARGIGFAVTRPSTIDQIVRGDCDANIRFNELCRVLKRLGFVERIRGDHHIFTRDGVEEILNLQPCGSLAKPYQVKQVRNIIVRYKLAGGRNAG